MSAKVTNLPATTIWPFPEWQREYMRALFELDPTKLPQRLKAAESVLQNRLRLIGSDYAASKEREQILDGLSKLRLLKNLSRKEQADAA